MRLGRRPSTTSTGTGCSALSQRQGTGHRQDADDDRERQGTRITRAVPSRRTGAGPWSLR